MKIKNLIDIIRNRRNVLEFDPNRDVKQKDIDNILKAARWAPSAGNSQPWELIIIRSSKTKEKLAEIHAAAMNKQEYKKNLPDAYLDASLLIAVCVNSGVKEKYPDVFSKEFLVDASIGALIENMWLATVTLGLGMGMGSQPLSVQDKIRELLKIPENLWVSEIIQIGYPVGSTEKTDRRKLKEFVHEENLDKSKLR